MASDWTDELRAQAIKLYEEQKPTPDTSSEAVKTVADSMGMTANGVRAILVRAGVYVKKDPTVVKATTTATGTGSRVNKTEAIAALNEIISNNNLDVDEEITGKLTGKAAVYFTEIFKALTSKEE